MSYGMMEFTPASKLIEQDNQQAQENARAQFNADERTTSQLASHISTCWESNKTTKQAITARLLDCLRRRNGKYSPDKLSSIKKQGGSEIYMMLCATKIRAASSWVRDILMPANGQPWGLEPSNVPEIDDISKNFLAEGVQAKAQMLMEKAQQAAGLQQKIAAMKQGGQVVPPEMEKAAQSVPEMTPEIIKEEIERAEAKANTLMKQKAREASGKMEDVIEDQLAAGDWVESFEDFIDNFSTFPTAFIKGPFFKKVPNISWDGSRPVITNESIHSFDSVSPFDLYPSADSSNTQDGSNLIELIRFTRKSLYACIGVDGYSEDAIREALETYSQGGLKHWVWNEAERMNLENKDNLFLSDDQTIEGLHYWGSAQGSTLLEWGVDPDLIDDPLREFDIDAILIGTEVIRCVIDDSPLSRRPYEAASYQSVPKSIWGVAIPELMADIEDMCNATARSLANNMGMSSGPMLEVNYDRLQPGEDPTAIYPWRVFQTKSSVLSGNDPAIKFFQVSSHANELMSVFDSFEEKADDATNIPRYSYGNQNVGGAGSTMGGLSMLMESANKGIKSAISRIDRGVIRPVIQQMFYDNMLYHHDESIKFDASIIAKGSSSMITRERNAAFKQQFLQSTNNPTDMQIVGIEGRAKLLREVAEDADLVGFVPDEKEMADKLRSQSNAPDAEMVKFEQEMALEKEKLAQSGKKIEQEGDLKLKKIESDERSKQANIDGQVKLPPRYNQ